MTSYAVRSIERGLAYDKVADAITPWGTEPRTGRGIHPSFLGLPGARDAARYCTIRAACTGSNVDGQHASAVHAEFRSHSNPARLFVRVGRFA